MNRKRQGSHRNAAQRRPGQEPNVLMPAAQQADSLFARATAAFQSGQIPEAAMLFRQVLNAHPGHADAHSWLGILLHRQGANAEAVEHLRSAATLRPDVAEHHCNLGIAEISAGDFEAARRDLEKAVALNPRLAVAQFNLGLAAANSRDWGEALAALKKAIALSPDDPAPQLELGRVLVSSGRAPEAVAHFQRLRTLFPDLREARHGLAAAFESLGDVESAAKELRQTVGQIPGLLDAIDKLGVYAANMGRFEEAKTYFDAALALYPDSPDLLYDVATNTKALSNSEGAARVDAVLDKEARDPKRAMLHFALGKIHDDMGAYAEAFANFKAGNDIIDRTAVYDVEFWTSYVDRLIAVFTKEFLAARKGFGAKSRKPIFIFGMPRSGTTLVEQIVASHPGVAAAGELPLLRELTDGLPQRLGSGGGYPECASALDARSAAELADAYLASLDSWAPGAGRATDKSPANYYHLGLLALVFPNAAFIHVRRNPMDTCLSCYVTNIRHGYSNNLVTLGRHYRDYERLMAHWRDVLPVPLLEINYEDLIADQEAASRRLIAHCGLEWDGRCLDFHKAEHAVKTASVWQVRQPVYKSSVGRWRRYEPFLGPLIEALEGATKQASRGKDG